MGNTSAKREEKIVGVKRRIIAVFCYLFYEKYVNLHTLWLTLHGLKLSGKLQVSARTLTLCTKMTSIDCLSNIEIYDQ